MKATEIADRLIEEFEATNDRPHLRAYISDAVVSEVQALLKGRGYDSERDGKLDNLTEIEFWPLPIRL